MPMLPQAVLLQQQAHPQADVSRRSIWKAATQPIQQVLIVLGEMTVEVTQCACQAERMREPVRGWPIQH